jgi:hypothetical protein
MIKSNTTEIATFERNGKVYTAPAGRWYKCQPGGRLLVVGDWREAGKSNPPVWQEGIDWTLVTFSAPGI